MLSRQLSPTRIPYLDTPEITQETLDHLVRQRTFAEILNTVWAAIGTREGAELPVQVLFDYLRELGFDGAADGLVGAIRAAGMEWQVMGVEHRGLSPDANGERVEAVVHLVGRPNPDQGQPVRPWSKRKGA